MKIWVDADACPGSIKEIIYKAVERLKISATFVANQYLKLPFSEFLSLVVVEKKFDSADYHIVEHLEKDHLVITGDILLASEVVNKGALAIDPRGKIFDETTVYNAVAVRNLMQTLREGRMVEKSGPRPFDNLDKKKFSATFEKQISILKKRSLEKIKVISHS